MTNINEIRTHLEQARREDVKAFNELDYCEQRANEQIEQLDTLLSYRDECRNELKTAMESGLTGMYMREYKLLIQHITLSVETKQYKVDVSQVNYEKSKEVWQKKHERFEKLKQVMKQQETVEKEPVANKNAPEKTDRSNDKYKINNFRRL